MREPRWNWRVLLAVLAASLAVQAMGSPSQAAAEYFDNRDEVDAARRAAAPDFNPYAPAGVFDHDSGFFLRLTFGAGMASSQASQAGYLRAFDGLAVDGALSLGAIVAPNLALHGTFFGWNVLEPYFEYRDGGDTASGYLGETTLAMAAFGPGLTYYFMPYNAYISGSLGLGGLSLSEEDGATFRARRGVAGELLVGKEWFVGAQVGLGLAGAFTAHRIPDRMAGVTFSGYSLGLRFSFTFN